MNEGNPEENKENSGENHEKKVSKVFILFS